LRETKKSPSSLRAAASQDHFDGDYEWLLRPARFAVLFDLAERPESLWNNLDHEELLRAQLNLPLPAVQSVVGAEPGKATMRASLLTATTPLAELVSIKDWAKAWSRDTTGPRDVAMTIYLCAIAAAFVHHSCGITRLSAESLRQQFSWALAQQWVDPELRDLLRRGADAVIMERSPRP
jgi:hypothetical protein